MTDPTQSTTPAALDRLRTAIAAVKTAIIADAQRLGTAAGTEFASKVRALPPDMLDFHTASLGVYDLQQIHNLVGDAVLAGMSDRDAYCVARDANAAFSSAASMAIAVAATRPA